jgi:mannan endo-1,4-beta-mannosidase
VSRRPAARPLTGAGRLLAVIALAAALAGCGSGFLSIPKDSGSGGQASAPATTGATPGPPYNVAPLISPSSGKYLGLEADGAPFTMAPVNTFAENIGRKPNLIGQYIAWKTPFDATTVSRAWSYGAMSYLAWEPYQTSVRSIARGGSDGYITTFAKAVRELNLPVVISFGHEMNGNWYPWGTAQTTAADFVAAWRHIHRLFTRAGARNVIWMWNPNIINPMPQVPLQPYYPGNKYVDWVGITGYFPTTGPNTYATLYGPTVSEIHGFTHKPFLIAETSVETGPDEVACVNQLVRTVTRHPNVLGFIWFDYQKDGIDWRVESRPILRAALVRDLGSFQLATLPRG